MLLATRQEKWWGTPKTGGHYSLNVAIPLQPAWDLPVKNWGDSECAGTDPLI
ncbi:MAG: hypothetical protein QGG39_06870 [Candidatus Poribacteria bacterium]|nr:hypothetical protein [Candidatus Poribacteria bacterium]